MQKQKQKQKQKVDNLTFLQIRCTNGQEAHKYSTLLVINKMQIKITLRYYFSPIRMTIIKKKEKNIGEDVERLQRTVKTGGL